MQKKNLKLLHWLNHGSYPGYTVLILGFKFDEVKRLMRKKKAMDWLDAFEWTIKQQSEKGCWVQKTTLENLKTGEVKHFFFIYLHSFDFSDYAYAKLAHECLHFCQFFLPDILDRNKEHEAECYLHTHMMMQCLNAIRGK